MPGGAEIPRTIFAIRKGKAVLGSSAKVMAAGGGGEKRPAARPRRLPDLVLVALFLVLALAVLYPGPLLKGQVFRSSDAQNADAFAAVGDAALREGDYPLWNPYLFCGMPTFGSLAYTRFLYPPSVVFNFLQQTLHFPPLTWLLAHLLCGGLGMAYLLSRWRLPTAALVLGALIWILAPKVVAWSVHGHGSKLGAAMYAPWIFAWAWNVLAGRGPRAVAVCAVLLGLQILRGHPQITYYTLLMLGWLVLWHLFWPAGLVAGSASAAVRWRRAAAVAVSLAVAFLLGAALLVPVHGYSGLSIRGDAAAGGGVGYDYATAWSLAPAELGTLVMPAAAGFGKATYLGKMPFNDYPNYLGWLVLGLAVLSWWSGRRRLVVTIGVMSLLAVVVAFGRHAPLLYDLAYRFLPYFNKFRVPSMVLIVLVFSAALLAGLGAGVLTGDRPYGPRGRRLLPGLVLGLGGLLLVLGGAGLAHGPYLEQLQQLAVSAGKNPQPVLLEMAWTLHKADLVRIGLILLAAGGAVAYAVRNVSFRRRGLLWVLVVLAAIDLISVDRRIVHPERSLSDIVPDRAGGARLVTAARLLQTYRPAQAADRGRYRELADLVGHDRIWPLGPLDGRNDLMPAGIRSLDGYHPAKLAAYETVRQRLRFNNTPRPAGRIAAWLAGRIVSFGGELGAEDLRYLQELGVDLAPEPLLCNGRPYYRNLAALPRARLVTEYQLSSALPGGDDLGQFLDALQAGQLSFAHQVILDREPDPVPAAGAGALPPPEFVVDGLDEVVLRTGAPVPALLLLADMAAPGWQVEIDGRPGDLLRADLILRAVALPAGDHEVRFFYRDPSVRRGLGLALLGLVVVLVLFFLPGKFRGPFGRSPAAPVKEETKHA